MLVSALDLVEGIGGNWQDLWILFDDAVSDEELAIDIWKRQSDGQIVLLTQPAAEAQTGNMPEFQAKLRHDAELLNLEVQQTQDEPFTTALLHYAINDNEDISGKLKYDYTPWEDAGNFTQKDILNFYLNHKLVHCMLKIPPKMRQLLPLKSCKHLVMRIRRQIAK